MDPEENGFPEDWYSPAMERRTLRQLSVRNNRSGLMYFGAWAALTAVTGWGVYLAQETLWLAPAMLLYGCVMSFAYAASHECAHGTAFRSRWLNEVVFWITSFIFMEEPTYRRYSHACHHTYTWINGEDVQKPYGNPMGYRTYLLETSGFLMPFLSLYKMARIAFGALNEEERRFTPAAAIPGMIAGSWIMLGGYGVLIVGGWLVEQTAAPFLFFFIPRLMGGWLVNLYINTQHMCMAEDIRDHRYTTRSIRGGWLERLLYWNMNYHIEHHLFPTVPFHALRALRYEISTELPKLAGNVLDVNQNILSVIKQQKSDPGLSDQPELMPERG